MNREQVLQAAKELLDEKKIDRGQMIRLRLATLNPNVMEKIHQVAEEEALASGEVSAEQATQGFDWAKLIKIIKVVLPAILDLLDKLN